MKRQAEIYSLGNRNEFSKLDRPVTAEEMAFLFMKIIDDIAVELRTDHMMANRKKGIER